MEIIFEEAATRGVLCKKMFLEISQNSQESTCEFCEILRTPFLQNTSGSCFYTCRLFHTLAQLSFTTSERELNYYHQKLHLHYE